MLQNFCFVATSSNWDGMSPANIPCTAPTLVISVKLSSSSSSLSNTSMSSSWSSSVSICSWKQIHIFYYLSLHREILYSLNDFWAFWMVLLFLYGEIGSPFKTIHVHSLQHPPWPGAGQLPPMQPVWPPSWGLLWMSWLPLWCSEKYNRPIFNYMMKFPEVANYQISTQHFKAFLYQWIYVICIMKYTKHLYDEIYKTSKCYKISTKHCWISKCQFVLIFVPVIRISWLANLSKHHTNDTNDVGSLVKKGLKTQCWYLVEFASFGNFII